MPQSKYCYNSEAISDPQEFYDFDEYIDQYIEGYNNTSKCLFSVLAIYGDANTGKSSFAFQMMKASLFAAGNICDLRNKQLGGIPCKAFYQPLACFGIEPSIVTAMYNSLKPSPYIEDSMSIGGHLTGKVPAVLDVGVSASKSYKKKPNDLNTLVKLISRSRRALAEDAPVLFFIDGINLLIETDLNQTIDQLFKALNHLECRNVHLVMVGETEHLVTKNLSEKVDQFIPIGGFDYSKLKGYAKYLGQKSQLKFHDNVLSLVNTQAKGNLGTALNILSKAIKNDTDGYIDMTDLQKGTSQLQSGGIFR